MKRLISLILAGLMTVSSVPGAAFANEGVESQVTQSPWIQSVKTRALGNRIFFSDLAYTGDLKTDNVFLIYAKQSESLDVVNGAEVSSLPELNILSNLFNINEETGHITYLDFMQSVTFGETYQFVYARKVVNDQDVETWQFISDIHQVTADSESAIALRDVAYGNDNVTYEMDLRGISAEEVNSVIIKGIYNYDEPMKDLMSLPIESNASTRFTLDTSGELKAFMVTVLLNNGISVATNLTFINRDFYVMSHERKVIDNTIQYLVETIRGELGDRMLYVLYSEDQDLISGINETPVNDEEVFGIVEGGLTYNEQSKLYNFDSIVDYLEYDKTYHYVFALKETDEEGNFYWKRVSPIVDVMIPNELPKVHFVDEAITQEECVLNLIMPTLDATQIVDINAFYSEDDFNTFIEVPASQIVVAEKPEIRLFNVKPGAKVMAYVRMADGLVYKTWNYEMIPEDSQKKPFALTGFTPKAIDDTIQFFLPEIEGDLGNLKVYVLYTSNPELLDGVHESEVKAEVPFLVKENILSIDPETSAYFFNDYIDKLTYGETYHYVFAIQEQNDEGKLCWKYVTAIMPIKIPDEQPKVHLIEEHKTDEKYVASLWMPALDKNQIETIFAYYSEDNFKTSVKIPENQFEISENSMITLNNVKLGTQMVVYVMMKDASLYRSSYYTLIDAPNNQESFSLGIDGVYYRDVITGKQPLKINIEPVPSDDTYRAEVRVNGVLVDSATLKDGNVYCEDILNLLFNQTKAVVEVSIYHNDEKVFAESKMVEFAIFADYEVEHTSETLPLNSQFVQFKVYTKNANEKVKTIQVMDEQEQVVMSTNNWSSGITNGTQYYRTDGDTNHVTFERSYKEGTLIKTSKVMPKSYDVKLVFEDDSTVVLHNAVTFVEMPIVKHIERRARSINQGMFDIHVEGINLNVEELSFVMKSKNGKTLPFTILDSKWTKDKMIYRLKSEAGESDLNNCTFEFFDKNGKPVVNEMTDTIAWRTESYTITDVDYKNYEMKVTIPNLEDGIYEAVLFEGDYWTAVLSPVPVKFINGVATVKFMSSGRPYNLKAGNQYELMIRLNNGEQYNYMFKVPKGQFSEGVVPVTEVITTFGEGLTKGYVTVPKSFEGKNIKAALYNGSDRCVKENLAVTRLSHDEYLDRLEVTFDKKNLERGYYELRFSMDNDPREMICYVGIPFTGPISAVNPSFVYVGDTKMAIALTLSQKNLDPKKMNIILKDASEKCFSYDILTVEKDLTAPYDDRYVFTLEGDFSEKGFYFYQLEYDGIKVDVQNFERTRQLSSQENELGCNGKQYETMIQMVP